MYVTIKEYSEELDRPPFVVDLENFSKDVLSVGRHSESDIRLYSKFVSRVHCCLYRDHASGAWIIEDAGSKCGMSYDGSIVQKKIIENGSIIRIVNAWNRKEYVKFMFEETVRAVSGIPAINGMAYSRPVQRQQQAWQIQPEPRQQQQQAWQIQPEPRQQQQAWQIQPEPRPQQQQAWQIQPEPRPQQQQGWQLQPEPRPQQQQGWQLQPEPQPWQLTPEQMNPQNIPSVMRRRPAEEIEMTLESVGTVDELKAMKSGGQTVHLTPNSHGSGPEYIARASVSEEGDTSLLIQPDRQDNDTTVLQSPDREDRDTTVLQSSGGEDRDTTVLQSPGGEEHDTTVLMNPGQRPQSGGTPQGMKLAQGSERIPQNNGSVQPGNATQNRKFTEPPRSYPEAYEEEDESSNGPNLPMGWCDGLATTGMYVAMAYCFIQAIIGLAYMSLDSGARDYSITMHGSQYIDIVKVGFIITGLLYIAIGGYAFYLRRQIIERMKDTGIKVTVYIVCLFVFLAVETLFWFIQSAAKNPQGITGGTAAGMVITALFIVGAGVFAAIMNYRYFKAREHYFRF